MRKYIYFLGSLLIALSFFVSLKAEAAPGTVGTIAPDAVYKVNIIAYETCPRQENAQRIAVLADFVDDVDTGDTFVDLDKRNKIFLVPGTDFRVLDSNACDSDGALLQLAPETGTEYEVWVRLVGPPDSRIDAYLCARDPNQATDDIVCSSTHLMKTRLTGKGQPSFTNATNHLLDINGTPLFDEDLQDYFWVWNTVGKPHAQVWIIDPAD